MKGKILDLSLQSSSGVISGEDDNRYTFALSEWKQQNPPVKGQNVDFEVDGKEAKGIYLAASDDGLSQILSGNGSKSKIAAGLFAIFLGGLGIHKFYLGYYVMGFIYLGLFLLGSILSIIVVGLFILIPLYIVCLIEGILYLTKSDEEFQRLYVENKRVLF